MIRPDDTSGSENRRVARIRAFLFDLDGVLWDSNALHEETMARACEEAGLEMPEYSRLAGLSTPDALSLVFAENGRPPSDRLVSDLTDRKRSLFQARIDEVTSDHEALRTALSERPDISRALVTGASRATADAYLSRLPVGFFDVVITGEDGVPSKPAPDGYALAMRRLGVSPRESVVFEDSEAGLSAARASGARVAHVTHAWGNACDGVSCGSEWCAPTVREALEQVWSGR